MSKLSDGHWHFEQYKQRMTTKEWKEILLNEEDKIFVRGELRQLTAKKLGVGVVEIYKLPIK